jgi:predicted metal-dependent hydrolase
MNCQDVKHTLEFDTRISKLILDLNKNNKTVSLNVAHNISLNIVDNLSLENLRVIN